MKGPRGRLVTIEGSVPAIGQMIEACRFSLAVRFGTTSANRKGLARIRL